ncbi:MAG: hypothetical protein H0W28_13600 [Pyrinomonadaceae bacterium]|nr:hypothetical protein [Pyrinomonadaceae bacterium]
MDINDPEATNARGRHERTEGAVISKSNAERPIARRKSAHPVAEVIHPASAVTCFTIANPPDSR